MDETFQARIIRLLGSGGATFQEISHVLGIQERALSLALGIMVNAGTIRRDITVVPTKYYLSRAI